MKKIGFGRRDFFKSGLRAAVFVGIVASGIRLGSRSVGSGGSSFCGPESLCGRCGRRTDCRIPRTVDAGGSERPALSSRDERKNP